jgi:hypothetical protein
MKTFAVIIACVSIVFLAQGAGKMPIKDGVLQSDLNVNGQKLTNVVDILDANGNTLLGAGPGGGEANTGANVGTGVGIFSGKSGVALQFKNVATSGGATVSTNSTTLTIAADAAGAAAGVQTFASSVSNNVLPKLNANATNLSLHTTGSDTGLSVWGSFDGSADSPIFDVDLENGFINFIQTGGTPLRSWNFNGVVTVDNDIILQAGSFKGSGSGLTNLSPAAATNNAAASDGWALTKSGSNLKLVALTGSGTVTSVALTVPPVLSVSGSPITGSGTFTVTATVNFETNNGAISSGSILKSTGGNGAAAATAGTDFVAPSTTITVAGTANQITSSAGAQDLSANRTATLSLPSTLIAPGTFTANIITNNGLYYGNGAALTNINAANITNAATIDAATSTNTYAAFDSAGMFYGTRNGNQWTNLTFTAAALAPASNATNYTINFSGADKQIIHSANTNAHFTFSNIVTNRQLDIFVYAITSSVNCLVDFPPHVIHNNGWTLTCSNGTMQAYHVEAHTGTDSTNVTVTGGNYYHRD